VFVVSTISDNPNCFLLDGFNLLFVFSASNAKNYGQLVK
jgi:hypothetical protein